MSNSSLVQYTKIAKNYSSRNGHNYNINLYYNKKPNSCSHRVKSQDNKKVRMIPTKN